MPQYELMYIIGSSISDDQIPKAVDEVKKNIEGDGGVIRKHEELGRKKLAYPIKHAKNGYYVVVNFEAAPTKMSDIEHKIRTSQNIIRHILVNMEETLLRMEKDRKAQAQMKAVRKPVLEPALKEIGTPKPERKIQIDLDAEIEKALGSEDLK